MLPLVFPGIVMGIAILKMYLMIPVPVYGTIWILVLAFIARYLPYGIRFSHSALLSLHKELEEGATASGASWFQMVRHVVVPLIMPALARRLDLHLSDYLSANYPLPCCSTRRAPKWWRSQSGSYGTTATSASWRPSA